MIRVCPLSALPPGEAIRVDLGVNQSRHFGRWRRRLNAAPVQA